MRSTPQNEYLLNKVNTLSHGRRNPAQVILKAVSDYWGIPISEMKRRSRKRHIVQPRMVAMYLMKFHKRYVGTLEYIGSLFSGLDHATVIHAYKTISNLRDTDKELYDDIERIELVVKRQLKN